MQRHLTALMSALYLLLAICSPSLADPAPLNQWNGSGPFATGLGNRVVTALAVSQDGKTVYAGTGSGTVFSYAYTPPAVTTGAASGIGTSGAVLNGTVNANNADAAVSFEYGPTTAYGSSVAAAPAVASGTSVSSVVAGLNGLTAGTVFHYRITAVNSGGTSYGADQTFTTWLAPTFTSSVATTFTYNSTGTFGVTAAGIPTPTFSATGTLPTGVTLNSNGNLSGTPTQVGTFPITITATNSAGSATQSFTLTVGKATATVSLGSLSQTYDGTAKSVTAATTPGGLSVTITYNGSTTAPVNAGTYTVAATVTDPRYSGSASGTLVTAKATPVVTWNTPAAITSGTALSISQLNASANVAGSFIYTPAAGSVPTVGNNTLLVAFAPDDTINYTGASASVTLTVNAAPTLSAVNILVTGSGWVHGTALSRTTGTPDGDIACSGTGGVCTARYPAGDTVMLTATPEGVATQFDSWSSDCAGQGNPCTLNLDGDKTVAALFTQAPLARNSTKGISYATLAEALSAANAAIPDDILLLDIGYEWSILTKGVKLHGGWNTLYQSLTGLSTFLYNGLTVESGASTLETTHIGGKLTLKGGSLRVKGVKVVNVLDI